MSSCVHVWWWVGGQGRRRSAQARPPSCPAPHPHPPPPTPTRPPHTHTQTCPPPTHTQTCPPHTHIQTHRQRALRVLPFVVWAVHHLQPVVLLQHLHLQRGGGGVGGWAGVRWWGWARARGAGAGGGGERASVGGESQSHPARTHAHASMCRARACTSLQMDSMNRYCHLPWKRWRRKLRRSSVLLVASNTATWASSVRGEGEGGGEGGGGEEDGGRVGVGGALTSEGRSSVPGGGELWRLVPPRPLPSHPCPARPPCRPVLPAGPVGARAHPPRCAGRRTRRPGGSSGGGAGVCKCEQLAACGWVGCEGRRTRRPGGSSGGGSVCVYV